MTVKQLRTLLDEAPDDMLVMISVENHLHPGTFAFMTACPCETGIAELFEGLTESDITQEAFLILPHGFSASEEETDRQIIPQAN